MIANIKTYISIIISALLLLILTACAITEDAGDPVSVIPVDEETISKYQEAGTEIREWYQ